MPEKSMFTETAAEAAGAVGAAADLAAARETFGLEISGLEALRDSLGADFVKALDVLGAIPGRAVATGMGKSGHIARKIAATFASTGTPALFVHPGEASHGDLGMITGDDCVLALSNSGETRELGDLIEHCRRFKVPLIAVTSKAASTLARQADVALVMPPAEEACPNGLAPTTSTTMSLVLGDALAVALMKRRGFSATDFRAFHPGGKLGARLKYVRDLMHTGAELPLTAPDAVMSQAILTMTEKRFGCVGVLQDGKLAGIVTDGDLRRHMGETLLTRTVGDVMTRAPKTVSPETLVAEALEIMNSLKITALFAVEDGRPIGILHIHDALRAGVA